MIEVFSVGYYFLELLSVMGLCLIDVCKSIFFGDRLFLMENMLCSYVKIVGTYLCM
jgi:hypothetical protein